MKKKSNIERDDEGQISKNSKELRKFVLYCLKNPNQRFWQSLINWSGFNISKVIQNKHKLYYEDLFYKE